MTPQTSETSEARFQSPEVRRRQILDAAAHLAVEEGLEKTSIARVAETAGVAKGSIYLHFESRQQLLAGLQGDLWQRMLERPTQLAGDEDLSWAAKLDAVVEHWMQFEFDHHGLYHSVFHTIATDSDEPLVQARRLLSELIDCGVAAGEFNLDGLDTAVVIELLLHGYIGPCFHHSDPRSAIDNVQAIFRRVVGAGGEDHDNATVGKQDQ